ncbi:MAG TPA: hypothetical protein VKB43_11540 [Gaiellaceae bacterium]|nr:hypothetical protein [Gaiellaceae bacterium]
MAIMKPDYADTVQQLMFNRILAFMQSMSDFGVAVVGFDAQTGTLEGRLSGVDFVVNVSLPSE